MLILDSLPSATRAVFEHLTNQPLLADYTLIGGSALALQINHRRSEDLDFWICAEQLDKNQITSIVRHAQQAGFATMLATPQHQIVSAKINGFDLLSRVQDYVIGGVKVTFLARCDVAFQAFDLMARVNIPNIHFSLMGEAGLFAMKSHLIHQRTRSRDLFDLRACLMRGKTVSDILQAATDIDPGCSAEYAKSVLLGDVPLDAQDEGFDSIGVSDSMTEIYHFFAQAINQAERALAAQIKRAGRFPNNRDNSEN